MQVKVELYVIALFVQVEEPDWFDTKDPGCLKPAWRMVDRAVYHEYDDNITLFASVNGVKFSFDEEALYAQAWAERNGMKVTTTYKEMFVDINVPEVE